LQIEPLGIATLLLGCLGLVLRSSFSVYVFLVSTLLGAGAALVLTSLGSANIQPPHLLLGFLVLHLFARREYLQAAVHGLSFPRPGFWLALTVVVAALSSAFFPRFFAGYTYVFTAIRDENSSGVALVPLGPTAGNVTQTVYLVGDMLCFLFFYGYCSNPARTKLVVKAMLVCAAANLAFAMFDLLTYWTNTADLMAFVRNAGYRMLDDTAVIGFKRIVGSFPEASSFAYATIGLLAFCAKLLLEQVYQPVTAPLTILLFVAIVFATSTTGYVGTAGLFAGLYLTALVAVVRRPVARNTLVYLVGFPAVVALLLLAARLDGPVWTTLNDLVATTITNKLSTASGVERSLWNQQALQNFVDTDWLGAGNGSVRASGLPMAVLGNIGIVGAVAYGMFGLSVLVPWRADATPRAVASCRSAARWACFAQLLAASAAGAFIDLGLPFFIFAGLATARPVAAAEPRRAAPPAAIEILSPPPWRGAGDPVAHLAGGGE
jgi:hypothetical protein